MPRSPLAACRAALVVTLPLAMAACTPSDPSESTAAADARRDIGREAALPEAEQRETAAARVGPDWRVVEEYRDGVATWLARARELDFAGLPPDEAERRRTAFMNERPSAVRATFASRAILEEDGRHPRTVEAAEFLVREAHGAPRNRDLLALAGARALVAHAPGYEHWPEMLGWLDGHRAIQPLGVVSESPIDTFLETMAASAANPMLRASARYYLAAGLMRAANDPLTPAAERAASRRRALDVADGLSAGLELEGFEIPTQPPGVEGPRTLAQAEADLVAGIRHATLGATLPALTGRRLDGVQESLSDYRGRVLLIDFWATWCPPCIEALPALRALVAELPADRFALLAISVDDELAAVTELLKSEPMPWHNWHAGPADALVRILDIRAFPTYVLADERGVILARAAGPLDALTCMAGKAVAGEPPATLAAGCLPPAAARDDGRLAGEQDG